MLKQLIVTRYLSEYCSYLLLYFPYCLSVRGFDLIGIRKHAVKVLGLPVNAWSQSDTEPFFFLAGHEWRLFIKFHFSP